MSFLDSPSSIASLSENSRELLQKVDPYVLDFNIFLFKGINETHSRDNAKLHEFLSQVLASIPSEYKTKIFNPIEDDKVILTTTSRLQLRLLELLIHERHRRDIEVINSRLGGKLQYIPLNDPLKYEIKSPFYLTFKQSNDDYVNQFYKLAMLQCLEYDFEHNLDESDDYQNDDDLVKEFCSDSIMEFKLSDATKETDIMDSELIKVLIPLASQVMLMEGDEAEDNDEAENKDEKV